MNIFLQSPPSLQLSEGTLRIDSSANPVISHSYRMFMTWLFILGGRGDGGGVTVAVWTCVVIFVSVTPLDILKETFVRKKLCVFNETSEHLQQRLILFVTANQVVSCPIEFSCVFFYFSLSLSWFIVASNSPLVSDPLRNPLCESVYSLHAPLCPQFIFFLSSNVLSLVFLTSHVLDIQPFLSSPCDFVCWISFFWVPVYRPVFASKAWN